MKTYIYIIFLLLGLYLISNANPVKPSNSFEYSIRVLAKVDNTCPDNTSNPNNISKKIIETLLKAPDYKNDRIETGIDDLDFTNLQVLKTETDGAACSELNAFVNQWLDDEPNWKYTYYKLDGFYFLSRWYDRPSLGFSPLFVFNSEFELISAGAY